MPNLITVLSAIMLLAGVEFKLSAAPAEIYLLRHAEKLNTTDKDPGLSPCGIAQAQAMAALIPATVTRIYHSIYQRTVQTAEHIRQRHTSALTNTYDVRELSTFAKQLLAQNNSVLVVGHSNTTPELIHLLSKLEAPLINEQDYGVVYQLALAEQGYSLFRFTIEQPTICTPSGT